MGSSMAASSEPIAEHGVAGPDEEERQGERQEDDVEHESLPNGLGITRMALGSPEGLHGHQLTHFAPAHGRGSVRPLAYPAQRVMPGTGQVEDEAERKKDDAEHARSPNRMLALYQWPPINIPFARARPHINGT